MTRPGAFRACFPHRGHTALNLSGSEPSPTDSPSTKWLGFALRPTHFPALFFLLRADSATDDGSPLRDDGFGTRTRAELPVTAAVPRRHTPGDAREWVPPGKSGGPQPRKSRDPEAEKFSKKDSIWRKKGMMNMGDGKKWRYHSSEEHGRTLRLL